MNPAPSANPDHPWAITRLEADRAAVVGHLARLRQNFEEMVQASGDSNADDEHDPEGSTIAFERSQLRSSIHRAECRLHEIQDAQTRVTVGRYGLCESCGEPVAEARIEALPLTRTCIRCAAVAP
jgi:RNA polymerase-binding transcription factor DksA